jgi:hypothetical protein
LKHGIADLSDPMLNDRISELKATRDQAHLAAERGSGRDSNAPGRVSHLRRVQAHRHHSGGYRRDHLHGLTQRVEVDQKEPRFMEPARLALASFSHPRRLNYATGRTAASGRFC